MLILGVKLLLSNENYKLAADVHCRINQEFNEGDYVMVRICSERYPNYILLRNCMPEQLDPIKLFANLDLMYHI